MSSPLSRRVFLRGLVAGAGATLLAACGGSPAAPTEPTTAPAAPAATSAPAAPAAATTAPASAPAQGSASGQTLNFMIIQPHKVTGDILKAEFEQLTGATVNVTVVPYDQVQAKATLDVQSGANELDVIDYWYTTIGALASEGIVEDLTDYIAANAAEIQPDDFLPSLYDTYTLVDGRRYGLPYDGDTHVLFYNTEIFARNGLTPPTTWDEYLEVARAISEAEGKNGIYGAALLAQQAPIIIGSSFSNRLGGFGGSFLDASGKPAISSEAALLATRSFLDAAPYALPTPLETAFDQGLPAFLDGKVAMIEFWTDLGVYAQDPAGSKIVDKWDAVQMPFGGTNTRNIPALNAGFGFAVSNGSKNKELARKFVKFATNAENHLKLLLTTGSGIDPMRKTGLEAKEYIAFAPKVQKVAAAALNGAFAWPTIPQSPELMTVLSDNLALVLQGNVEPEAALATVEQEWNTILG
jgi:multiple sugar transport system substrate-binding protein